MITHDETKKAHARLFDSYISGHFAPFPTRSDLDTIKEYIAQQQQQDELLELYRECYEEGYFWLEIQQRIKALEEELK